MRYLLPILFAFAAQALAAQLPVTAEFNALLDSFDLRLYYPDDPVFKLQPNPENDYLADQLTLYSKGNALPPPPGK